MRWRLHCIRDFRTGRFGQKSWHDTFEEARDALRGMFTEPLLHENGNLFKAPAGSVWVINQHPEPGE